MSDLLLRNIRVEALVISAIPTGTALTAVTVDYLIRNAVRRYHVAGIREAFVTYFDRHIDCPTSYNARVRWAHSLVAAAHPVPHPRPAPRLYVHTLTATHR